MLSNTLWSQNGFISAAFREIIVATGFFLLRLHLFSSSILFDFSSPTV